MKEITQVVGTATPTGAMEPTAAEIAGIPRSHGGLQRLARGRSRDQQAKPDVIEHEVKSKVNEQQRHGTTRKALVADRNHELGCPRWSAAAWPGDLLHPVP